VLPDGVDGLQKPTVDRAGDPGREATGMWALRRDALADEHSQAHGSAMDGVAFGHPRSVPEVSRRDEAVRLNLTPVRVIPRPGTGASASAHASADSSSSSALKIASENVG
jgi:hypothetical protein